MNEQTKHNPWGSSFQQGLFNMATDSRLFSNTLKEGLLPLYEAKMFWHFDHRFGDYADYPEGASSNALPRIPENRMKSPDYFVTPRYWVEAQEVERRLYRNWHNSWFICFRDVTKVQNERTTVFSLLPKVGVGHTAPLIFFSDKVPSMLVAAFLATVNSLTFDYVTRQKMGGIHLTYMVLQQLPVLPPDHFSAEDIAYIAPRVLELVYTAWDILPFAEDVWAEANEGLRETIECRNAECNAGAPQELFSLRDGFALPPFRWNEQRRALIRAELDARIAKLYDLTRDELRYILDPADVYGPDFPGETFRVLKEKEAKLYGEYRTRRLVLEAWDRAGY